MDIRQFLKSAVKKGRVALTETESKQLLHEYGVPVVHETVALTAAEAIRQAEDMGFPVVIKGLGATLLHKTEQGLVHLNVADADAVKIAVSAIKKRAGHELEGILVQPQLQEKENLWPDCFGILSLDR